MSEQARRDDAEARRLALTALDRTLLVEAGAGSGKTSVLAGRVVALMASGRDPRAIAAITFTELAASELRERVVRFTEAVLSDDVPVDLAQAFPGGATAEQRAALERARDELDGLSCSTIHSFCQTLLTPYPVEADMDPGASVMDREEADALFAEQLDDMLRERLVPPADPDDALVTFFLADPGATRGLIDDFAGRLRSRPDLRAPSHADEEDARDAVRANVAAFRAFVDAAPCREPETDAIVAGLEAMAGEMAREPDASPAEVLRLLRMAVPGTCATAAGAFKAYRAKTKWKAAAKGLRTAAEADRLNDGATACYEACKDAHGALKSWAATRALQLIEPECRAVVERFTAAKRASARLDFDDLMLKTRELLMRRADVRGALAGRYASVLVDEFQDTDPLQVEILWRLAAVPPADDPGLPWAEWPVRPGALFLVGDPKQAIYRFRGADVASYATVRECLRAADPGAVIAITQNFRSVPGILDWVNRHFEGPLTAEGQPGFAPLFAALAATGSDEPVVSLPVDVAEATASLIRDAEADAVADLCAAMIDTRPVRDRDGTRPCRASDIALLAPGGTELWRYERALEERGIAVSTQAGKGFFRRQEVHDMIALTRAVADGRDTLALGALLRGPLVGLTEEELLDATAEVAAASADGRGRLGLWTATDVVTHPLLRETLAILQGLAKRASGTTPYILLCAAVEEMGVRPIVRRRRTRTAERGLANVDLFLELARPYDVRGLRAFAGQVRRQWEEATRTVEARPDTSRPAVSLITMHSSKGLEWPVVIPINTATGVVNRASSAVDAATGALHMGVFKHYPSGTAEAIEAEKAEHARERHRIWYVAATRARELLVLPRPSCGIRATWWMGMVEVGVREVEPIAVTPATTPSAPSAEAEDRGPDRQTFAAQAAVIRANARMIKRLTPHLAEGGDAPAEEVLVVPGDGTGGDVPSPAVRGSRERGLILHKLIEEVLTGEVGEEEGALSARASELLEELGISPEKGPDPAEMARSVQRGLGVAEVVAVRDRLMPEVPVAASQEADGREEVTIGVADALALDDEGRASLIIDWKSDVAPTAETIGGYRDQVRSYLGATGTAAGLIVFLSSGVVERVMAAAGR